MTVWTAKHDLNEKIIAAIRTRRLQRVSVDLPESINPLEWLRAQNVRTSRVYWSGRDSREETVAIGAAHCTSSTKDLIDLRSADPAIRYFGGMRFDKEQTFKSNEWKEFGTSWFILPRFELVTTERGSTLSCNLLGNSTDEEALFELDALDFGQTHKTNWPTNCYIDRMDYPSQDGWNENVEAALKLINSHSSLQKLVLARKVQLSFDGLIDPTNLLRRLKKHTPHCFHFLFSPTPNVAFIGATPERLYQRDTHSLISEAVAGTRPRGTSNTTDLALGDDLLSSDKDLREHRFVIDSIEQKLRPLCSDIRTQENISLLKLARVQHLYCRVECTLDSQSFENSNIDLEILNRIHPTPAVAGTPTEQAIDKIRSLEPFDRGWYAGPIGWINAKGAEFAVAIRSGLVRTVAGRSELSLYSGAGIVQGSLPESEWREIELKISDFLKTLGTTTEAPVTTESHPVWHELYNERHS